jgi:DNA-binding SARP family transcriptional activator
MGKGITAPQCRQDMGGGSAAGATGRARRHCHHMPQAQQQGLAIHPLNTEVEIAREPLAGVTIQMNPGRSASACHRRSRSCCNCLCSGSISAIANATAC